MKKPLWVAICVVLLAVMGCRSTSEKEATAPPTVRALTPPPPPITVESITEANYREMLQRLTDEINHDGQVGY